MIDLNTKPDIVTVINQHVNLWKTGKNYAGLCPFHSERTPSFMVSPDRQLFKCFGCGASGDVIAFIQNLNRCDFKQALEYLGLKEGSSYKVNRREQRKRELVRAFRKWCNDYYDRLCSDYRDLNNARHDVKDMQEVERLSKMYRLAAVWEYHMDILCDHDDHEKLMLYLEVGQWTPLT